MVKIVPERRVVSAWAKSEEINRRTAQSREARGKGGKKTLSAMVVDGTGLGRGKPVGRCMDEGSSWSV